MKLAEIVLPAGKQTVTVREIPRLLAAAIHPDKPEDNARLVSYLLKQANEVDAIPAPRPEHLTDDDWVTLNAIWRHLPPYREGLPETEWVQYAQAFENARNKPDWLLDVCWRNEGLNTKILQCDAENQHLEKLKIAILRGEVTPLNRAHVAVQEATGEALMNAMVTIDDLIRYAAKFHVGVRMSFEKKQLSKAPPPIKPLSGSGGATSHARPTTTDTPNWKEWKHTPEVRVWQACALSLGIDPHSMEHCRNGWLAGPGSGPFFEPESFPSDDAIAEFEVRQRVLLANLSNCAFFSPGILHMDTPGNHRVRLSEFASWAVSEVKWDDLPPELVAMAQKPDKQADAPADTSTAEGQSDAALTEWSIGWYDANLDASTWWGLTNITPSEAAMLLCQFNPHNDTAAPLTTTNDETGPDVYRPLLRVFEDVAQADPQRRTLSQWLDIACVKGLKYHSWIDNYRAAIEAANGCAAGSLLKVDGYGAAAVTVHTIKTRNNILDPAIDKAIKAAGNLDTSAVFLALRELALEEEKPFIGSIEQDALCYTNAKGEPDKLTKEALGKRLKRRTDKGQ